MDAGLVPIKSPLRAKRRLAEVLDSHGHRDLTRALVDDVFQFCARATDLDWWIVSDDENVRSEARAAGFNAIADEGTDLNAAIAAGILAVADAGADALVVIPADVPLAQPEDAQDILDTGAFADVVAVPASDGGTNGLYLKLPTEMALRFGPESLRVHVEEAARLGLRCTILDLPRLAIDLDTPEDARAILGSGESGGRTLEVLARLFG